jgi:hypothetical protein
MPTFTRRRLATAVSVVAIGASALGASAATAAPVTLDGVRTTLTTDAATTKVLTDNRILPLATGDAKASFAPLRGIYFANLHYDKHGEHGLRIRYAFPITGGTVDSETLAGNITHSGGLVFVNLTNGKSLAVSDFTINIDDKPDLTAAVAGDPNTRVSILDLDLSAAKITKPLPFVRVRNVKATLTQGAADALNATLGTTIFAGGLTLGTAKVTARVAG